MTKLSGWFLVEFPKAPVSLLPSGVVHRAHCFQEGEPLCRCFLSEGRLHVAARNDPKCERCRERMS